MFLNIIRYIKQQNIETGLTKSYSLSRKKSALRSFKYHKTILRFCKK